MSSWRQRLGHVNGFRLYPLASGEAHYIDTDLSASVATLNWLSELGSVPADQLALLTLRHLDNRLLKFGAGRAAPRWVMPLHYSRRDRPFPTQYCPACLAEDEQPFFRLRWRLALATSCPKHSALFLEGCPRCGQPAWPASSTISSLYRGERRESFRLCPICSFDLGRAPTVAAVSHVNDFLSITDIRSDVLFSPELTVPAAEFAAALWVTCQLFIRARSRRLIETHPTKEGELTALVAKHNVKTVEQLPLEARHALMNMAVGLFLSWPMHFVRFSEIHGIAAEHFSESRADLPRWFLKEVDTRLAKQRRGVTAADIEVVSNVLIGQGKTVTKAELGRILGSRYSQAVMEAVPSRNKMTTKERMSFLGRLEAYVRKPVLRLSSSEMRLRNAVVLLLSVGRQIDLAVVIDLDQGEVHQHLQAMKATAESDRFARKTVTVLEKWVSRYELLRSRRTDKRPAPSSKSYFESFRGGKSSSRAVQFALNQCLVGIDATMKRSITIIWK